MLVPVGERVVGIEDPADQRLLAEGDEPLGTIVRLAPGGRGVGGLVQEVRRAGAALPKPVHAHQGQQLVEVDGVLRQLLCRVRPLPDLLDDPGQLGDGQSVSP